MTKAASKLTLQTTPITSVTKGQAKASVLAVYKALQRKAPTTWWDYGFQDMPLPVFRMLIKKEFMKNAHIKDIRVIDRMVEEAKQHLYALDYYFYNEEHLRNYFYREDLQEKPKDFMTKFLHGKD